MTEIRVSFDDLMDQLSPLSREGMSELEMFESIYGKGAIIKGATFDLSNGTPVYGALVRDNVVGNDGMVTVLSPA